MSNPEIVQRKLSSEAINRNAAKKIIKKTIVFYVEGKIGGDDFFYAKFIKKALAYSLSLKEDGVPVEMCRCNSCSQVYKKFELSQKNPNIFYILDSDFSHIAYTINGKYSNNGDLYSHPNAFFTYGYSIENYAINESFIHQLVKMSNDKGQDEVGYIQKNSTTEWKKLENFIEKCIPITVCEYILFTRDQKIEKCQQEVSNLITNDKIDFESLLKNVAISQRDHMKLETPYKNLWIQYVRGKNIQKYIKMNFTKSQNELITNLIAYLDECPRDLNTFIDQQILPIYS